MLFMTTELAKNLESLAKVEEYLERYGCCLAIVRKPRDYNYINFSQSSEFDDRMPSAMYGKNNVRARREAAGMTIRDLADAMGVQSAIVYRMEKEGMKHRKSSMQQFADFFNCTIDDLLKEDWEDD